MRQLASHAGLWKALLALLVLMERHWQKVRVGLLGSNLKKYKPNL